jgi:hypothetical protein
VLRPQKKLRIYLLGLPSILKEDSRNPSAKNIFKNLEGHATLTHSNRQTTGRTLKIMLHRIFFHGSVESVLQRNMHMAFV